MNDKSRDNSYIKNDKDQDLIDLEDKKETLIQLETSDKIEAKILN